METDKKFGVIYIPSLNWPAAIQMPSKKFRLFVAADITGLDTEPVSDFALAALNRGMVYFCAWGPDCERFHDIVDELTAEDEVNERKFSGPSASDVVMTTWHAHDSLEEAIEFFATCAVPTEGFAPDSDFRLAVCVGNEHWATEAERCLRSAGFFV